MLSTSLNLNNSKNSNNMAFGLTVRLKGPKGSHLAERFAENVCPLDEFQRIGDEILPGIEDTVTVSSPCHAVELSLKNNNLGLVDSIFVHSDSVSVGLNKAKGFLTAFRLKKVGVDIDYWKLLNSDDEGYFEHASKYVIKNVDSFQKGLGCLEEVLSTNKNPVKVRVYHETNPKREKGLKIEFSTPNATKIEAFPKNTDQDSLDLFKLYMQDAIKFVSSTN